MDREFVALAGFVGMFGLMALRVPIGIAMGIVGVLGFGALTSMGVALNLLGNVPMSVLTDYNLSVIPMFILMGALASQSGMSRELFVAGRAWFGHRRGGLAYASIASCAGFAAINGSSVATAATMSQVALPEMRRAGYDPGFSAGLIAARQERGQPGRPADRYHATERTEPLFETNDGGFSIEFQGMRSRSRFMYRASA